MRCIVPCAVSDLPLDKEQTSGEMFLQQWGTKMTFPKCSLFPFLPVFISNSNCPILVTLLVDIVIYCSVLACWNNACDCLQVARACVSCCMFCTFCDHWLALLHKERKLLGNSWRWKGGVVSQLEMEGLQGRSLNYTHTKGRSHGGHFLRPPAPQIACGVSCRWCPCYISFVGHAFQFLIWK